MARIPSFDVKKEEFPEAPWMDRLLRPLKNFTDDVRAALTNGLTFSANMVTQTVEFQVTLFEDKYAVIPATDWGYYLEVSEAHYQPPVWRKLDNGMIWLNGSLAGGNAGSVAFVLPAAAAPLREVEFWATGSFDGYPQPFRVRIDQLGSVWVGEGMDQAACEYIHMNASYEAADVTPVVNPAFPVSFLLTLGGGRVVKGVVPLRVVEVVSTRDERIAGTATSVEWTTSGDQLVIQNMPGLLPGRRYKVTLLVTGE